MISNTLLSLFPVPRALAMPAVGFDMSSDSIKFIEITGHPGGYKIGKYSNIKLSSGTIEKGQIKKFETLKKSLVDIRLKHNLKNVNVSLPEEKAYVFNLVVPYVPPDEIPGSIELQLEEQIPLPADSVVFDYEVIGFNREADTLELNIAVLEREIVEAYIEVFDSAGFYPLVFETEAQAASRSVIKEDSKDTYMIVDLGHSKTSFSIISNGYVSFNSTLDFGGKDITEALIKDLHITKDEAEKLKIEQGLSGHKKKDEIFSACFASLAVLKDEVNKYYSYWNHRIKKDKDGKKSIEKILFCGGVSALNGFEDFLTSYLDIPFELANPWINILSISSEIPDIHKNEALKFCIATGLALGSLKS